MKYLFALILLSSCYTAKKAEKQLDKAIQEFPALAAEKTRDRFPCITTGVHVQTDTVYELLEVECPQSGIDTPNTSNIVPVKDTLSLKKPAKLKQGSQLIYFPTIKVKETSKVEDNAKIYLVQKEAEAKIADAEKLTALCEDKVKSLQAEVSELEDKNAGKRSLIWWLIILLLLSIGGNYLQAKRII